MQRSVSPTSRPNVVVFVSHDTGRYLPPYGAGSVRAPASERLARESVMFSQCFATSPLCSPARAALFTGRYPHQNGVHGLVDSRFFWTLGAQERHAAHLFGAAGYSTVLCQGCHEVLDPATAGFVDILWGPRRNGPGSPRNTSLELAPALIDGWLAKRDASRPFYLQISSHETHRDFTRGDPAVAQKLELPHYLRDIPEVRDDFAAFIASVEKMDRGLAALLDLFDKRGLAQNTIFVATTDHGIDFPRAKGSFYDPGIEAFLFMRYPAGRWLSGQVRKELLSHVDVLPTLLEAAGIAVPGNMTGRSFLPLLTGVGSYQQRDAIFGEKTFHDSYDPTRVIRTNRWKYIRYFDATVVHDIRQASVVRSHYRRHPLNRPTYEELYDLNSDPREENDLAQNPDYVEPKEMLRRALRDWMQSTEDSLLAGPVPSLVYERAVADLMRD